MTRLLILALIACGSSPAPATAPVPAPASSLAESHAAPSPVLDEGTIRSRFRDCGDEFVGQVVDAPGVTCAEVCKVYGYGRCRGRAGQAGFAACAGRQPVIGSCDEGFEPGGPSQCDCTNVPLPKT